MSHTPADPPSVEPPPGSDRPGADRAAEETLVACDAVLFDMDGTLVDSRALVERLWVRWAAEHDIPIADVMAVAHGRRTLETIRLVAPHLATVEEAARLDALEAQEERDEMQIPGAAALLESLPRERWAVVTSAGRDLALSRLAAVGLPRPDILVGADDVAVGKPDPEGYLKAARVLGITPSRIVVVEDTPAGAQAGRAAGAFVVGLCTTFPRVAGCNILIADLRGMRLTGAGPGSSLRFLLRPTS